MSGGIPVSSRCPSLAGSRALGTFSKANKKAPKEEVFQGGILLNLLYPHLLTRIVFEQGPNVDTQAHSDILECCRGKVS